MKQSKSTNNWLKALKIYNDYKKTRVWSVPKKNTKDYDVVMKIKQRLDEGHTGGFLPLLATLASTIIPMLFNK